MEEMNQIKKFEIEGQGQEIEGKFMNKFTAEINGRKIYGFFALTPPIESLVAEEEEEESQQYEDELIDGSLETFESLIELFKKASECEQEMLDAPDRRCSKYKQAQRRLNDIEKEIEKIAKRNMTIKLREKGFKVENEQHIVLLSGKRLRLTPIVCTNRVINDCKIHYNIDSGQYARRMTMDEFFDRAEEIDRKYKEELEKREREDKVSLELHKEFKEDITYTSEHINYENGKVLGYNNLDLDFVKEGTSDIDNQVRISIHFSDSKALLRINVNTKSTVEETKRIINKIKEIVKQEGFTKKN